MRFFFKKRTKEEKIKELQLELEELLKKILKKETLWKIILDKEILLSLKKIAIKKMMELDLTPAELEDLIMEFEESSFICERDIAIKRWKDTAAPKDVFNIIMSRYEYFEHLGWQEFKSRFSNNLIKKDYAKWALQQIILLPTLREEAWKMYCRLILCDPSSSDLEDLKKIIDDNISQEITSEAQVIATKIHGKIAKIKKNSDKEIAKICKSIEKIEELKKG